MSEAGLVLIFPSLEAYWEQLANKPLLANKFSSAGEDIAAKVSAVLAKIRSDGDVALLEYGCQAAQCPVPSLRVGVDLMEAALSALNPALKDVWIEAVDNIERFHMRQYEDSNLEFSADGSVLGWKVSPIDRVGLCLNAHSPAGLFMSVLPAQLAGVKEIMVMSPPAKDGIPQRDVLAAAALLGVEQLYAVGGVPAIAALAWGTETIQPVDKIVGSGDHLVIEAGRQVGGALGVKLQTDCNELLMLCTRKDISAEYLARELLAQAEQGAKAWGLLVTTSEQQAQAVALRLGELIESSASMSKINTQIMASIATGSGILVVQDLAAGLAVVNELAPKNLALLTADPLASLAGVRHAGAILLGEDTPVSLSDYFAGSNHLLPAGGGARFSSPLGLSDFTKHSTVLSYSPARLKKHKEKIQLFAEAEQLSKEADQSSK